MTTQKPTTASAATPAILQAGLRPFFLAGASWALLSILLWVVALHGAIDIAAPYGALVWHGHEMIYGFATAIMAGFLLTAVPGWTGRPPLTGSALAALTTLWLAGRLGIACSATLGVLAAAAIDLSFLACLCAYVSRQVIVSRNWRNLPICAAPAVLLAGNALVHAEILGWGAGAALGNRIGIAAFVLLIAMIGGRIIPTFTGNWLKARQDPGPAPVPFNRFDVAVLLLTLATLLSWLTAPAQAVTAVLAALCALAHGIRLGRWRGGRTLGEPLVWILHLAYAWLPLAFILLALAAVYPVPVPESAALHALTAGAMTAMMLAMMTRAALGHTGRPLHAGAGTTAIYLLAAAAALCRIAAAVYAAGYFHLIVASSVFWIGAFLLYLILYGPMLLKPRIGNT